jgi:peptidoglycan/xylan/chitin deacetylase (PgdA/CDA1 family)
MKKKRSKSNARLLFGLAFCIVCGVVFGYFVGGCSHPQQNTSSHGNPRTHAPHSSSNEVESDRTPASGQSEKQSSESSSDENLPTLPPAEGTGEISNVVSKQKEIALTFDAGASAEPVDSILKTLAKHDLHVTFFLTGKWCEQNPELVKRIYEAGHEIGNHTYSHKDLRKLDDAGIAEELEKTAALVSKLTGNNPAALARPPYGGRDARVLAEMRKDGYVPIYWSLDSLDAFKTGITSDEIYKRIIDRAKGGDIVLMHCGSKPTADALDDMIVSLSDKGYSVVTVSKLIAK